MSEQLISAEANPKLVNEVIDKVTREQAPQVEPAKIVAPLDTVVNLPGGRLLPSGEVARVAEVRELNGRDEEAVSKASSIGKALLTILSRGVVTVGEEKATEQLLDEMLSGDRDELLLGIYKATFGVEASIPSYCSGCDDWKDVDVNVNDDVTRRTLSDPVEDRYFTVKGRKDEYLVTLPNGVFQKEVSLNENKTSAELSTVLLEQTILQINGKPSLGKFQVQGLGVADRREIAKAIAERNIGPRFDDVTTTCPDCGGEVAVPINLGTLFQL